MVIAGPMSAGTVRVDEVDFTEALPTVALSSVTVHASVCIEQ